MTSFQDTDPVRAYIEARRRLAEAEAGAEAVVSAVASVAAKLGDWKDAVVSTGDGSPGLTIDGIPWPTDGQIAAALATWHEARAGLEAAWRSVQPGDRASLQPQPSGQESPIDLADTTSGDVPATITYEELGREVAALTQRQAEAQGELDRLLDQFIETGTVENLPSRPAGFALSKGNQAVVVVAEAERRRNEIQDQLAEARDRFQQMKSERDRENVLDRLKETEERLRQRG